MKSCKNNSGIPDFFIIVAVSHRNTIVINIEIKVQ